MPRMTKLAQTEIDHALESLSGWSASGEKLHKEYRFPDFVHAFGFMAMAAMRIEALNHHPEWFNVYGTVRVDLTTHDAGGISQNDVTLASILDELAMKFQ